MEGGVAAQVFGQGGLADARLAVNEDNAALVGHGGGELQVLR